MLSVFLIKTTLVLVLVMMVLFVWRGWRRFPGLAPLAAAVATFAGVLLYPNPSVAAVGLLASAGLLIHYSRPRR
jgi:hypothetical protein